MSNYELGEQCVELARQVRDGEHVHALGRLLNQFETCCPQCGCETIGSEHEHGVTGCYCEQCHAAISQEIYEHECGLLNSGYYG